MRPITLLCPLLLVSTAQACINDRDSDSLAVQAKKLPDTLRVITGRFERNPPLYYEMRIRRSLVELKQNPRQFGLYDDIGAAYDRLHRSDEAMQIMATKRAKLPVYDAKNPKLKEVWYRYYANVGTFRAHRWLGAGAKKGTIAEMKQARAEIKRAIEIKPNAHFGREKYQLMTMNWILATRTSKTGNVRTLGEWIDRGDKWENRESPRKEAVEGLMGLVVLGAAWQSPDVFEALAYALDADETVALRHMALLRSREILQSGKASMSPASLNLNAVDEKLDIRELGYKAGVGVNDKNQKTLADLFLRLRTESDVWAGHRNAFMLANLEKGSHPDTNAQFWNGWKPAPAPSLDVRWFNERTNRYKGESVVSRSWTPALLLLVGILGPSLLILRLVSKRRLA